MADLRTPDKTRPVLVLTRNDLIPHLQTILVASVTSTIRGLPTEVSVGVAEGLKHESCVNLVTVNTLPLAALRRYVGTVAPDKMRRACEALAIATGCS